MPRRCTGPAPPKGLSPTWALVSVWCSRLRQSSVLLRASEAEGRENEAAGDVRVRECGKEEAEDTLSTLKQVEVNHVGAW